MVKNGHRLTILLRKAQKTVFLGRAAILIRERSQKVAKPFRNKG